MTSTSHALVLGSSSGIGLGLAKTLHREGWYVTGLARTLPNGEAFDSVQADAIDHSALEAAVLSVHRRRPVTHLLHSIGLGRYAPTDADRTAAWRAVIDTNLLTVANTVSIVNAHLRVLPVALFVGSMAAHRPSTTPGNELYEAAKRGSASVIESLVRRIREEGRTTRVVVLSPGYVEGTGFGDRFFEPREGRSGETLYRGRTNLQIHDISEIALAALRLSDRVGYLDVRMEPSTTDGTPP